MSRDTVIFNFRKGFAPLEEAFEANGYRMAENEWTPTPQLAARCEAAVVNLYDAIRRPWDAVGLHRRLRAAGAPLIGVDRDAPWHLGIRWRRLALFRLLRPLDIYATHTLQPTWEFSPLKIYNPNAAWTRCFNLHGHTLAEMRNPAFFEYDVSFLGNMDGERYKEHAQRARFFAALRPRLDDMGIRHYIAHSSGVDEETQIRVTQRSHINLSYRSSSDHGGTMSWGLPERCYGVPARGGFLLTDERRHAADDFDLATEWAGYTDMDNCLAKIRYYLDRFDLARDIAEAAHARVIRDHTYEKRAMNLIRAGQNWRKNSAD